MRAVPTGLGGVVFSGTVAAVLSSLVIAACGRIERGRALATHNGPAQWLHGRAAGYRRAVTVRDTLAGFVIHHASSCWWAYVQQRVLPRRPRGTAFRVHAADGAVIALLACIVDYRVVPERLQPGFEKHISRKSLAAGYVAFGLGLAIAACMRDGRQMRGSSG